jgi:hypothetical protein
MLQYNFIFDKSFICFFIPIFFLINRQEAAGALWNLSFDDRNREAIAVAGGVEALVNNPTSLLLSSSFFPQSRLRCYFINLSTDELTVIHFLFRLS